MLDHLPDLVNANEPLVRRGRFFSCTFLVGIGATDWLIKISNGRVASATSGPHLMQSWQFSIRAPEDAWVAFWKPEPRPGFHDIFAMTKSGTAVIAGDRDLDLGQPYIPWEGRLWPLCKEVFCVVEGS